MPVDDYGNRADLVVAPETLCNRMNLGQLYEQFINLCSQFVMRHIKQLPPLQACDYVLEFISDVNYAYAKSISKIVNTDELKIKFINTILKEEMIYIVLPPFVDGLDTAWCLRMEKKYNIVLTPIEYNLRDNTGKVSRRVRTLKPQCIAKKYIYVLCKIPHARSCGVSYVNQFGIPIRLKTKKSGYPIGLTPIRIGEDEARNLILTVGSDIAYRILALYANAPEGTDRLVELLLTEQYPTKLERVDMTNEELSKRNKTIQIAKHLMHTCGVDMQDLTIDEEERIRIEQFVRSME